MKTKQLLACISALALLGSTAAALPASAAVSSTEDLAAWMNAYAEPFMKTYLEEGNMFDKQAVGYTTEQPAVIPAAPEQEQFDLRDVDGKNYVTSVKDQCNIGVCYAFSAMAAAESSVAYERGIDLNTADEATAQSVDFSERHFAWFSKTFLPENPYFPSQAGEGIECSQVTDMRNGLYGDVTQGNINYSFLNTGGFSSDMLTLFTSFQGPQLEERVPYGNDEKRYYSYVLIMDFVEEPAEAPLEPFDNMAPYVTEGSVDNYLLYRSEEELKELIAGTKGSIVLGATDWYHGTGRYYYVYPLQPDYEGTWSVDESLRFTDEYRAENIRQLPSPCASDENGAYHFQLNGLNAIKSELVQGRAVTIGIADFGIPDYRVTLDENAEPTYQQAKTKYCCMYSYDKAYDASDPESINHVIMAGHEVTIIGYDDHFPKEYFNDPNGTIAGDGAFIAKNSWNANWGEQGFFHISYYDQSLTTPMTIDFELPAKDAEEKEKLSAYTAQIYDLMPSAFNYEEAAFDKETAMANVFTADEDMMLTHVSYTTHTCNEEVTYSVYLLDDDAKDPADGVLAATVSAFCPYGGFQKTALKEPVAIRKGQRYSVVVTSKREDGMYGVNVTGFVNPDGEKYLINTKIDEVTSMDISEEEQAYLFDDWYAHMWYNKEAIGEGESYLMTDGAWTDWSDIIKLAQTKEYSQYLNFDNFSIKAYGNTEILNVVNTAVTQQETYQAGDTVNCRLTVQNVSRMDAEQVSFTVNGKEVGRTDRIASKESMTVEYPYTVTEEDVANGAFRADVQAFCESGGEIRELDLMDGFSTPTLTVSLSGDTPETEPASGTETDTQPGTSGTAEPYTEKQLCDMAVKDYEVRTGTAPSCAEASANPDGSVTIRLLDDAGALLSVYQIDPVTGKGTDSQNASVDLPKTGNTDPGNAAAASAAAILTVTGALMTMHSRRKREE